MTNSWVDAYSELNSSWPYVRVPMKLDLEPIDDYSFPDFMDWLEMSCKQEEIFRRFRPRQ